MTTHTVRLIQPAELVAALPRLIGFNPAESVVLAAFDARNELGPTVRADLVPVGEFEPVAAEMLAQVPARFRHTAALIVTSARPRSDALDDLARVIAGAGMRVTVSVYAAGTRPGAQWTCCCGCAVSGRVPQPPTMPDRDAVAEILRPDDEVTLARRARLLVAPGPTGPALDLERVIDEFRACGELSDAAVVELVRCLRDTDRSVAVLGARTGDLRRVLEALVRATPQAWVAGPAAFLALAALLQGDVLLADLAAQRATAADPGAPLSRRVARLAATFPSPDTVRELLHTI